MFRQEQEQHQHQVGRKAVRASSPRAAGLRLAPGSHILELFARPQAAPCLSRQPRLQPAGLCPTPALRGEELVAGWGGDSAPMSTNTS